MASSFSFSAAVPCARSFSIIESPSSAFSMVTRAQSLSAATHCACDSAVSADRMSARPV